MNEYLVIAFKILAVGVLVLLNGFFVAAEFALVKVRESRLIQLSREGRFGANVGLHLLRNLNSYLSAAQLGITMTSLGLGWIGEPVVEPMVKAVLGGVGFHHLDPVFNYFRLAQADVVHVISAGVAFGIITFLHIVVGEQAPKVLAIQKAEDTTLWIAWPMRFFHVLIFPAIWFLNASSLGLLKILGLQPADEHDGVHSADELRTLLKQSTQTNQLTPVAGSLLLNALDLRRRKARQVMLHRTKVIFLSTKRSMEENLKVARQAGYSRFPLCEGSMDQVVGMVHLKDLMWLVHDKGKDANINSVKRDVLFVPETMPLERLLNTFLTKRIHLAILVDEYGTIVGMVTLENILEEIVGDIQDEFDQESLMFQKVSDNEFRIHGELPLHDLEELLGIHVSAEDVTTVGGYVIQEFGHFPQTGEKIAVGNYELTVVRAVGHQIAQITAKRVEAVPAVEHQQM